MIFAATCDEARFLFAKRLMLPHPVVWKKAIAMENTFEARNRRS
jgi:hypothetical protein